MDKIGIGITTYNRPQYLQQLVSSLIPCKDITELVVINDGEKLTSIPESVTKWIDNEINLGVGKSKNKALKYLLEKNCDYIFIIEDDVVIKNINVFKEYIKASTVTGIQHFNFGPGSPFNRKQTIPNFDLHNRHLLTETSEPNPKLLVDYKDYKIELYQHIAGVFSFFTHSILNDVGLIDEEYKNAWEHVDHTNRIINAGGHPPFWWFADIANSIEYLDVQPDAIQNSTTSKNTEDWIQNVQKNAEIYKRKNGHYPAMTPVTNKQTVLEKLKQIKYPNKKDYKLLIKFPTRSRPDQFFKVLDLYYKFLTGKNYEFIISCDIDDNTMNNEYVIQKLNTYPHLKYYFGNNKTKIEAVNADLTGQNFDILLLASDDMVPMVNGYDDIIRSKMNNFFPDTDGVLWFNDGHQQSNLNTLSILGKKYYDRFGYIYHPAYKSLYCDNEFTLISKSLNKTKYFDFTIIKHQHHCVTNDKPDELYMRNDALDNVDKNTFLSRMKTGFI